mgnify:CR=1 FL=1
MPELRPYDVKTVEVIRCNNCGGDRSLPVGGGVDFEYGTCRNEFRFVRCADCGLVYLKNRPAVEELDTIYGAEYIPHFFDEYLGGFISNLRRRVQRMKVSPLRRLLSDDAVVVDVGPGGGEFLTLLRDFGSPGWDLYGVDFSAEAVEGLHKRGLKAVQSRFETLEWQGPPVDAIVMNQVIEHLEDPAAAVEKAQEILAPDGILFLETPSVDSWDYMLFKRRHWGGWHIPRHWHLYDETTLAKLVTEHGFEVTQVDYLLSPNFWLQSVHHYVDERLGWKKVADWFDVSVFPSLVVASGIDVLQKLLRRRTSNFRLVARKRQDGMA